MSRVNTTTPDTDPSRTRRLRLLLLIGSVVAVAALVLVLVLLQGDDEEPADPAASRIPVPTAAVPSATAATPTSVAPGPTGPVVPADELPPALAPVPLDGTADAGGGVTATLPSIEAIQGTANGPGNIAGPALRVTVRIQNGTGEPVSLDAVAVNVYLGEELTPASPLDDPSQEPFTGRLQPGESADGIYVFTVPTDRRDAVTVEAGHAPGAPFMRWTGPVG